MRRVATRRARAARPRPVAADPVGRARHRAADQLVRVGGRLAIVLWLSCAAVGTSLVMIAITSATGLAASLSTGTINSDRRDQARRRDRGRRQEPAARAGFHVGANNFYLAPAGPATVILVARGGIVREIGIADNRLTHGGVAQRRSSARSGSGLRAARAPRSGSRLGASWPPPCPGPGGSSRRCPRASPGPSSAPPRSWLPFR